MALGNAISLAFTSGGADADALAFIEAAGITDNDQILAIGNFVAQLKEINAIVPDFVNFETPANSILKAAYPFVGGTADQHKYNLINPLDSDAAFRLTYSGTVAHTANGIQGNGVDGICDTKLNPATVLDASAGGLDTFINGDSQTVVDRKEIGARVSGNTIAMGSCLNQSSRAFYLKAYGVSKSFDAAGFKTFQGSGCNSIDIASDAIGDAKYYLNSRDFNFANASLLTGAWPSANIHLCNINGRTVFSDQIISYAGIRSKEIGETAMLAYHDAIVTLQNRLSRLPLRNVFIEGDSMMITPTALTDEADWKVIARLNAVHANRVYDNHSFAWPGNKLSDLNDRWTAAENVSSYVQGSPFTDYLVIHIGTNDLDNYIPGGASLYWDEVKAYVQRAITAGFTPIVNTILHKVGGAGVNFDTLRVEHNNYIMTDMPTGAHGLNLELESELTDSTDLTYFNADQIHLNATGSGILADAIIAFINAL